MRRSFFLPIMTLLLLGAGCALSSVDSERAANVEEYREQAGYSTMDDSVGDDAVMESEGSSAVVVADDFAALTESHIVTEPRIVTLKAGNFAFEPSVITAKAGERLMISFSDVIGEHQFMMDELNIHEEVEVGSTISFTAPTVPGRYPYFCDEGAHKTLGMEGVLIVE